ncbi:MAG: hypothetical protein ACM37W_06005 [Actinomycetota bacterium]
MSLVKHRCWGIPVLYLSSFSNCLLLENQPSRHSTATSPTPIADIGAIAGC